MTQKELDQAANKYDENLTYSPISEQYDVKKAFVAGAKWRINSVWHEMSDIPKDGFIILLIGKDNEALFGPNMRYYKEAVVMDNEFDKWAYIYDLLAIK